jgi:hypothetical protein
MRGEVVIKYNTHPDFIFGKKKPFFNSLSPPYTISDLSLSKKASKNV